MPGKFMVALGWGDVNPATLNFNVVSFPKDNPDDVTVHNDVPYASITKALVASGDLVRAKRAEKSGWDCKEVSTGRYECVQSTKSTDAEGKEVTTSGPILIHTIVDVPAPPKPEKPAKEPKVVEYELNDDGTQKLDTDGNPIVKKKARATKSASTKSTSATPAEPVAEVAQTIVGDDEE